MRSRIALVLLALLGGCGISNPIVKSEVVSFDDVIENATDKLLVLNILRARDQAPLHFMALPSLRQSIKQSSSLSVLELTGPRNGSTQRSTATLGMSLEFAPTFDLNHLSSKEFVTGMTSPIESKYVKYWIDRGLDRRLVMLLFFSSAEYSRSGDTSTDPIQITNTPKASIDEIRNRIRNKKSGCDARSQFESYLNLVNKFTTFSAKTAPVQRVAACIYSDGSDSAKFLQALAAAEQSKMKYKYVANKKAKNSGVYKLYSGTGDPQNLFCLNGKPVEFGSRDGQQAKSLENAESCLAKAPATKEEDFDKDCPQHPAATEKEKPKPPGKPAAPEADRPAEHCPIVDKDGKEIPIAHLDIHFTIRSVGEMIHFLGDLLYYQDALNSDPIIREGKNSPLQLAHHVLHDPVTIGYCRDDRTPVPQELRGISDILFNLGGDSENARFTVPYRDKTYAVGNYVPGPTTSEAKSEICLRAHADRKDHTLEVLSVVQALTHLHQSATELRTTPVVQVIP